MPESKKFSAADSIWIAAAIYAYKQYMQGKKDLTDYYLKAAALREMALKYCAMDVQPARIHQHCNGDHRGSSHNFLKRKELKKAEPVFRLTAKGEFHGDREIPGDLHWNETIYMDEQPVVLKELLDFVNGAYTRIVQDAADNEEIDYIGVLNYLRDNQEVPYSDPAAPGLSAEERNKLLAIRENGQSAAGEMKKMAAAFAVLFDLDKCLPVSWLDGSNRKTRKYLWAQMKYSDYADSPVSVSIFAEGNDSGITRYRISLEIKNDSADKRTMEQYHSHLDMPLNTAAGLVYVSGINEWGYPCELKEAREAIKKKVEAEEIRKVQISRCIERKSDETNLYYHQEIVNAIGALLPYYEHVIGKDPVRSSKCGWLLTWNPANWNWEGYAKACISTKAGRKFMEDWTCTSKKPEIGEEVYLLKTGEPPRGILAHGHVVKKSYEAEHFNKEKAAAGVTRSYIGVAFDWIQNYENDPILPLEVLKEAFPDQHWNPMGSGIEIKEACLPQLRSIWDKTIKIGAERKPMKKVKFDKNLILYGPPGTGKTYQSAIYAVAICDHVPISELTDYDLVMERFQVLKKEGQVAFTTFHQSYGYEEFIEGIKPVVDSGSKDIAYTVESGIFKKFCERAGKAEVKTDKFKISADAGIWKATIRRQVKQDCFENNRVRIDWAINSDGASGFVNDIKKGDLILTTDGSRSFISGIAVVTSDEAYALDAEADTTARDVQWLAKDLHEDIKNINNGKMLHRMTCTRVPYMNAADLVILAKKHNAELKNTEIERNDKPYVFIIDEINRGNISKIFGELITLIEKTKRAGMKEAASALLPYSGTEFSVPSNVYILGTMNTADRSIAIMDTALRRRFQFIEMMPDADVLRRIGADKVEDLDVAAMLEKINQRISFLYDREHTIGHGFFTGLTGENATIETLQSIFEKSVIPLLQEYFYEDYQKIQLVLGDTAKSDPAHKFILDQKVIVKEIFHCNVEDIMDLPENSYVINKKALGNIDSYKEII